MSPKFGKKPKQEKPEAAEMPAETPESPAETPGSPSETPASPAFGLPDPEPGSDGGSLPTPEVLPPVSTQAAPATEPPLVREPETVPVISTPAEAVRALADGRHQQPHDLLGHHLEPTGLMIRAYRPFASSVAVILSGGTSPPRVKLSWVPP